MVAWGKWTNAHGGINGHKVKVIEFDDKGDPATALSEVKTLVQQDHVMAIVGDYSITEPVWAPYVQQHKIPVIGGTLAGAFYATNPYFFATGTLPPAILVAGIDLAKKEGATKAADMVCAESPLCAQSIAAIKPASQAIGIPVVYTTTISASAPSYAAECLAAKSAGADTLVIGDDSNTALRVYQSCSQQGYNPIPAAGATEVDSAWLAPSFTQGKLYYHTAFPWFLASTPATRDFHAALRQYAPGALINGVTSDVWAAAQVFKGAAISGKLGNNPTPSQVNQAMYTLPAKYTTNGLTPPLTYKKGKVTSVNCWFVYGINHHQFTGPDGLKTTCLH